jgi:uncharacterized protein YlxW (UPF0749 family)
MAEEKTAAQLRDELSVVEWKEYLGAKRARQAERIELLTGKIAAKQRELDEAKQKLADVEAQIKSGVVGVLPKSGTGVVVTPLPGTVGVKGA